LVSASASHHDVPLVIVNDRFRRGTDVERAGPQGLELVDLVEVDFLCRGRLGAKGGSCEQQCQNRVLLGLRKH
jgi:hypothetical protein